MGKKTDLHVELHDGFSGEAVSVWLDGEEVWQTPGARTRLQIDLADAVAIEVEPGEHRLEVRVPELNTTAGLELNIDGPWWVAVNLSTGGRLAIRESNAAFRHA